MRNGKTTNNCGERQPTEIYPVASMRVRVSAPLVGTRGLSPNRPPYYKPPGKPRKACRKLS